MTNSTKDYFSGIVQHLVPEISDRFGIEGLKTIEEALNKFGIQEGQKIRIKVEASGLEPNLDNFLKFNKIINVGSTKAADKTGYEIYHCPIEGNLLDENRLEVGRMLCHLDRAMLQGYNPALARQHSNCIRLGSRACYFVSRVVINREVTRSGRPLSL
ncbi:MAG TPA: L-2-amino-thiazoline-4-carboxylic acid hydrolase [Desulfobacteria bacterium]|nr:L-2-amino-thiazoline-4-carboxylic acid hydrolase [Desulfobacteria bacterium]